MAVLAIKIILVLTQAETPLLTIEWKRATDI
jgi:hypothetical protein